MDNFEPVQTLFEIKYKNAPRELLSHQKILEAITGEVQDQKMIPGFNVRVEKKRAIVILDANTFGISVESGDSDIDAGFIITLFGRMSDLLGGFGEIQRLGLKRSFIQKQDSSSEQLKREFKEKYLGNASLIDESTDVALPLTLKAGDFGVNFMHGPMQGDEVNNQLAYKPKVTYKSYLFLGLDFYQVGDVKLKSKKNLTAMIAEVNNLTEEIVGKL